MKTPISNNLKALRKKRGLTQKDVAEYLGFKSTDRISRWEKGLTYPHVVNFLKLIELYKVHPSGIYSDSAEQSKINSKFLS